MALRDALIIGIDPGLAEAGWGLVRVTGSHLQHVAHGTVRTRAAEALAARLALLHSAMAAILTAHAPGEAAIEETFMNRDGRATLKLAQARGVAVLALAQAGLEVAEYAPNLIKKSVVGAGHAEKHQVRAMVERLLPGAGISCAHAADALAVAITHAHLRTALALAGEAARR